MSYKISYYCEKKKPFRLTVPISIAIVLTVLAFTNVLYHFDADVSKWSEYLFPWKQPEIQQAFSAFTEDLADGKAISDCFEKLCIDILHEPNGYI